MPLPCVKKEKLKMAQIKNVIKKEIQEDGIVIYNQYKKPMDAFTSTTDNRKVDALPERWGVGVVVGKFDPVLGFSETRVLEEFRIDKEAEAKQFTYGKKVIATFEMSGDKLKPLKLELKK